MGVNLSRCIIYQRIFPNRNWQSWKGKMVIEFFSKVSFDPIVMQALAEPWKDALVVTLLGNP